MISPWLKTKLSKYWHWPVLFVLVIGFFISVSSFNYYLHKDGFVKWISPDETANYVFAKLYAQEGTMKIHERYNLYVKDIIHPRSFRSDFGDMKPVSFIGLPFIFGSIGSVLGYEVLPYLTPFFASVGIIFFYLLVRKIFGARNALYSAFLLAFFPVFAYYSARSMFHNVLFVSLLLIGLYFTVMTGRIRRRAEQKFDWQGFVFALSGGTFVGLAVITRTSELLWMAPMFFFLWIFNLRNIGLFKLIIFISFFLFSLMPSFYWNQVLYGNPTSGGYPEMNTSVNNIITAGADLAKTTLQKSSAAPKEIFYKLKDSIFFFGFHPRDAARNFNGYFARMFPWLFWPSIIGFFSFLSVRQRIKKRHIVFIAAYLMVASILVLYYGSWKFNDNPDPNQMTIGNSYTRYWLPIYLGAMPFFSWLVLKLTDAKKRDGAMLAGGWADFSGTAVRFALRASILALIALISANFVIRGSSEGLAQTFAKQLASKYELERIMALTERNSTIITRYHDKLFFPERKVIVGLFNDANMVSEYAKLARLVPVYYYNFTLPLKDAAYLNEKKLADAGLRLEAVEKVTDELTLYSLAPAMKAIEAENDKKIEISNIRKMLR